MVTTHEYGNVRSCIVWSDYYKYENNQKIKITTKNLGNQVNGVTIHNVLENKIRHLVKNLKYSSLYENAR